MDLTEFLLTSAATDAFKADLVAYGEHGPASRIQTSRHTPRVKVMRVIAQLLHAEPTLPVDSVQVDGYSGCADFKGTIRVTAAGQEVTFHFVWDCQWRATQQGWNDHFGLPDQIRAAREFGWRCFQRWERVGGGVPDARQAAVGSH